MRFGFAVKVLGGGGLPSHDTRRRGSDPHLSVSLDRLEAILGYLEDHGIGMYRMATALAPYASHPDHPELREQPRECAGRLAEIGARARAAGIRLSTHPGQYTVLNSENDRVVALAVDELEVQAEILDGMGLGPEAVVVLHVGGAAGGTRAGLDRFARGFERLSGAARERLVIENDDRVYGLADALELSRRIGRPVVWDVLHHHCHDPDGIPDAEALALAAATWPDGVTPKVHFSSPRTAVEERRRRVGRRVERSLALPPLRAHADLVDPIAFEHFLRDTVARRDVDVMLEAKAKDLALLRLREQLAARGLDPERAGVRAPSAAGPPRAAGRAPSSSRSP